MNANIGQIYVELTRRYQPISDATIMDVLTGKTKVTASEVTFIPNKHLPPSLAEAEDAFKKYNCAIFTAFRGGYTLDENLERNAQLKRDMEELGMDYRPVNGCYREAEWEYPCVEYCFFVYNANESQSHSFFENAYSLSAKYNQDSFLYKRAGINRTAFLVATTDAGRKDLHGDIKFAGQLYIDVPDVQAWTDCSDGRFAFLLKGMVLIATGNRKVKIGEGDVFDIEGYNPDGIVVMYCDNQLDMANACKEYKGTVPLIQHVFNKDHYSETYIHDVVFRCLKKMRDLKCKRIGLHCSVAVNGSTTDGAAAIYEILEVWVKRFVKNLDWIVVVDTYGDYSKIANTKL